MIGALSAALSLMHQQAADLHRHVLSAPEMCGCLHSSDVRHGVIPRCHHPTAQYLPVVMHDGHAPTVPPKLSVSVPPPAAAPSLGSKAHLVAGVQATELSQLQARKASFGGFTPDSHGPP